MMSLIIRLILRIKNTYKVSLIKFRYKEIVRQAKKVGTGLKVNQESFINNNTYLGNNVNFNGLRIQGGGKVEIGNNFHSGTGCTIIVRFHNYENADAIPYDDTYIDKDVIIKNNVWIGNNVTILGGVIIEEGVIIQAGSVVVSDIPKYAIAGGHPAKVFKYRNKEHYEKLKTLGKFH